LKDSLGNPKEAKGASGEEHLKSEKFLMESSSRKTLNVLITYQLATLFCLENLVAKPFVLSSSKN